VLRRLVDALRSVVYCCSTPPGREEASAICTHARRVEGAQHIFHGNVGGVVVGLVGSLHVSLQSLTPVSLSRAGSSTHWQGGDILNRVNQRSWLCGVKVSLCSTQNNVLSSGSLLSAKFISVRGSAPLRLSIKGEKKAGK